MSSIGDYLVNYKPVKVKELLIDIPTIYIDNIFGFSTFFFSKCERQNLVEEKVMQRSITVSYEVS